MSQRQSDQQHQQQQQQCRRHKKCKIKIQEDGLVDLLVCKVGEDKVAHLLSICNSVCCILKGQPILNNFYSHFHLCPLFYAFATPAF